MSIFTKVVKPEGGESYCTFIRGTKIAHGEFLEVNEETKVRRFGNYRYGKLHGIIGETATEGMVRYLHYEDGVLQPDLVITKNENFNGVPFEYSEIQVGQNNLYTNINICSVAKYNGRNLQKILSRQINVLDGGVASKDTFEAFFEPEIGGPTYPTLLTIYKDVELGKAYSLWCRPCYDGKYIIIAMARLSVEKDLTVELGYRKKFDEIVVLATPEVVETSKNPNGSVNLEFIEKFNVNFYEALKEKDNKHGMLIEFTKDENENAIIAVSINATDKDNNVVEIKETMDTNNGNLLLQDLQRGSGSGIAAVRDAIVARYNESRKGEVSGSSSEDVQGTGDEAPSVPSGNEDGNGNPEGDSATAE